MLTSFLAAVAQRPNGAVLCAHQKMESSVLHEGDGPYATRLKTEFGNDLQPWKGENQHVTCRCSDGCGIHGTHGSA